VYSPAKPRDRSHFEQFRTYHERLYAQVEPTSVTPYSRPALERALHAVVVGWVRQFGTSSGLPYPVPTKLIDDAIQFIRARAHAVTAGDASVLEAFDEIVARRTKQWTNWTPDDWQHSPFTGATKRGLMRNAGDYITADLRDITWATPTSMRNVDAACETEITTLYAATSEGGV
jgi:hypothetical protein